MTMIGEVIGNHRLNAKVGDGDTGTVYRAEHTVIGSRVAVKFIHPEYSRSKDRVDRFFGELRKVSALGHPSVVEFFDFGYHEDRAYVVMEYVEHETLAARLPHAGRLPIPLTVALVRQIAGVLAATHQAGIVHGNLKPDNIALLPDSTVAFGERVKLLDFGMAALLARDGGDKIAHDNAALPTYSAPEWLQKPPRLDPRSDLYGLGCVWFEMLCGRPPFVADAAGELIAQHIYGEPPMPRSLNQDISPGLERLLMKLLAKQPEHRFATAGRLLDAIDALGEPGTSLGLDSGPAPVKLSFDESASVRAPPVADSARISPKLLIAATLAALVLLAVVLALI